MKLLYIALAGLTITTAVASCSEDKKGEVKQEEAPNVPTVKSGELKIAYYQTDTLNKRFTYLVQQEEIMTKKQEKFQKDFESRQRSLQQLGERIMTHRQKMDISGMELQQYEQQYQRQEQSLMSFQQSEGGKIQTEAGEIQNVIAKKVEEASKEYCKKYNIDILLMHGNGGQFGFINPAMDVTDSFIDFVNARQSELEKDLGK